MPSPRIGGSAAAAAPAADPMLSIRSVLPSLPPAELRVARDVLERPSDIVSLSIGDLAARASTSSATVVRFCQRAGFSGYPGLRLALAARIGRSTAEQAVPRIVDTAVRPDDRLEDVVAKVGALDAEAIEDTVRQLDIERLAAAADAIVAARRIELYGIGASGLVAVDLEQKLRRIGLPAAASTDGHGAMTSSAVLTAADVAIGISHSGQTLDVIEPMGEARARGATTLAITNDARSSLARRADLVLTTAARESLFRAGAMSSRAAQLTVIDCIYVAVARQDYERTVIALERTSAAVSSRRSRARGTT